MTNFIVENNLPIAVADKCGPCSEICSYIRKFSSVRKTTEQPTEIRFWFTSNPQSTALEKSEN